MKWVVIIIVAVAVICWVAAVVAYIHESRRENPAKSFQIGEIHPQIFQRFGLFGYPTWFLISTIAVVMIAPIYVIEWLWGKRTKPKV